MVLADIGAFTSQVTANQNVANFQLNELSRGKEDFRFSASFSLLAAETALEDSCEE